MTTWEEYYRLDARYRWNYDWLEALRKAGHVLVCPEHGPPGVGAGLTPEQATALAFRGYVDGGDRMSWRRSCEKCASAQIEALAASLLHAHRTGRTT